jgi:PKD repeat protein
MYGSIHTWIWDFGDGSVITILDPASPDISHLYASNGTFNVILRVATSNGCIATAMNPVMIRPMPVANYSVSSTQCELSPVHFTDQSQINGGSTITQWLWNFNDPVSGSFNNSTIPDPVHSFSASGIFNVTLTVTSADGCFNSITKPVSINVRPVAQFTSDTACAHSATQFTDHSIANAAGISSWHWNFGDPGSEQIIYLHFRTLYILSQMPAIIWSALP